MEQETQYTMQLLIYHSALWFCVVKGTTDIDLSASYLDLHVEIESEVRLRTKHYDKRDDFNFLLGTFHLYVATFKQHLQMEYISVSWYDIPDFLDIVLLLTRKILRQRDKGSYCFS